MEPTFGIVVTTNGSSIDYLEKCLSLLVGSEVGKAASKIVVTDDSWSDEVRKVVESHGQTYVQNPLMYGGFASNANNGIVSLPADMSSFILMHDDIILNETDGLIAAVRIINENQEIGLISPKNLFERGNVSAAHIVVKSRENKTWTTSGGIETDTEYSLVAPYTYWYKEFPGVNVQAFVQAVKSGLWVVNKAAFDSIGLFDEHYVPCFLEDVDACFALRKAGYKIMYMPSVSVIHPTKTSVNSNTVNITVVGNKNIQYLYDKFKDDKELFIQ